MTTQSPVLLTERPTHELQGSKKRARLVRLTRGGARAEWGWPSVAQRFRSRAAAVRSGLAPEARS